MSSGLYVWYQNESLKVKYYLTRLRSKQRNTEKHVIKFLPTIIPVFFCFLYKILIQHRQGVMV